MLRAAALIEIDREIRSVMLWALRAISSAWDTRRLGYGNESPHPYEHEVAALVGCNAGFAPDYVAAAGDVLAEHEAALAADPQHRNAATPVAELIDEFGLSSNAVDVLLVIAAPALHGNIARLYGILGNDPGRSLVDELLVHQVLGDRMSRHDIAAELHPRAPLVRLGSSTSRSPGHGRLRPSRLGPWCVWADSARQRGPGAGLSVPPKNLVRVFPQPFTGEELRARCCRRFELRRAAPTALAGGLAQLFELTRDAGASPA